MRALAVPAVLLLALATVAGSCGGNVVVDAQGSSTGGATTTATTTTSTTTTATVGVTTSSTGGPACPSPTDCSQCTDYASCYQCNLARFPAGVPLYMPLDDCHHCYTCFSACSTTGCDGTPPTMLTACDSQTPSTAACNACLVCADKGTYCKPSLVPCDMDPDCKALMNAIGMCPTN